MQQRITNGEPLERKDHQLLLIFLKNEEYGKVKTRLAKAVGHSEALEIYRQLKQYTLDLATSLPVKVQLWYSWYQPDQHNGDSYAGYETFVQEGVDLGERMKRAFKQAFQSGYNKVAVIGSDCAELEKKHLEEAFRQLDQVEVVIGPARDGGYYLIGMNQFYPKLFEGITWSSQKVLEQTLQKIADHNYSYSTLTELNDVDTIEDWQEVAEKFKD